MKMWPESNDDVVMEILARLPAESLCRFKAVSPVWRDLISSPCFLQRHTAAHCHDRELLGFLQEAAVHETSETLTAKHCNIITLISCKGGPKLKLKIPRHVGNFINSSNGLVLCSRVRGSLITFHVGNPLTGTFVELPPPPHGRDCLVVESDAFGKYGRMYSDGNGRKPPLCSAGLIANTNSNGTICNYSVVRAGLNLMRDGDQKKLVFIDSYSSETGKWSPLTKLVATGFVDMRGLTEGGVPVPPLVANGIIHWYTLGGLAVYDPKAAAAAGHTTYVQLIDLPRNYDSFAITRSTAAANNDDGDDDADVLCLGLVRDQKIMFYTLPKTTATNRNGSQIRIHSREWVLMREVSIPTLGRRKGSTSTAAGGLVGCKKTRLEFLIPGTTPLEMAALLRQDNELFLYNLQDNTIQNLPYSGGRINHHHKLAPYFKPSSLASYSL